MDSSVAQKFCENCGKNNEVAAKFCKSCGNQFPQIDHPAFQHQQPPQLNQPQKPIYPTQSQPTSQNFPENNQQRPRNYDTNASAYRPQANYNQNHPMNTNYGMVAVNPPRMWRGKGIFDSIIKMFRNPEKYAAEILEDPKAPSIIPIILLYILSYSALLAVQFLNIDYLSVDVEPEFEHYFTSESGKQDYAYLTAGVTAFMIVILWLLVSWVIGALLKNGMNYSHYGRHNSTQVTRKLLAYMTIPFTIKNLIMIYLVENESNREVNITSTEGLPSMEIVSDYSNSYYLWDTLLGLGGGILAVFVFYKTMKAGFGYQGFGIVLVSVLIVFASLIL